MYDYNFYEQMDSLMVNLLVDLAINMVRVLYATVRYVLMQPMPSTIHVRNNNYHKDYEIIQVRQNWGDLYPEKEEE